jgi:hypothetical protein
VAQPLHAVRVNAQRQAQGSCLFARVAEHFGQRSFWSPLPQVRGSDPVRGQLGLQVHRQNPGCQ